MAKIITEDVEKEVEDGSEMREPCEELGVPFSCTEGICGTCMIDIEEGQENLSELTPQEEDMGMSKDKRLACQCKINKGLVKIRY